MEWGPLVSTGVDFDDEKAKIDSKGDENDGELSMLEKIFVYSKSEFKDHRYYISSSRCWASLMCDNLGRLSQANLPSGSNGSTFAKLSNISCLF
jgi:hypothetical protein